MKTLINDVVLLDKKAQNDVNELKKEKEMLASHFNEMKKMLTAQRQEKTKNEISEKKKFYHEKEQAELEKLDLVYQEKTKTLNQQFEENQEKWLDELFLVCTKS